MNNLFIRNFFKKYFSDDMDANTCMMYIDMHFKVEDILKTKYKSEEINEELVIGMVNELMTNSKTRSMIVANFRNVRQNLIEKN